MVTSQNEMLTTDSGNVEGTGMQHEHAIPGGGALPGGDGKSPTVHTNTSTVQTSSDISQSQSSPAMALGPNQRMVQSQSQSGENTVSATATTHSANTMMTTSRVNSSVVDTSTTATSMASNMVSDTSRSHITGNQSGPGSGSVFPESDKSSSTVQPATVKSSEAPTTASSDVVPGIAAGVGALILLLLLVLLVVLLKRRAKMGSFTLLRRTSVSVSLTMMNSAFQHISTQQEDHELWQGGSVMNVYETSTTLGNSRASLALRTSGSEFNADIDQDEADAYLRTADELNKSRRLSTDTAVTLMSVHTQSSETNLSEYNAAAESPSNSASSDAHLPTKGAGDGANFQPSAKPAKRTLLGRKASVAPSVPMDLTEEIYTSPTRRPLAASRDESSLDISLNTRSKSGLASDTYALPVDVIARHTTSRLCSSATKITDTSADLHSVHIHTDDDYCTPKDAIHKVKKFLETESIDVTGRRDSAEQAAGGTAGTRTSANDDKTNTGMTALAQLQPTVPLQQGSLGNDYLEGTKHRSFDRELEFLTNLLQSEAASGDSVTGNQGLLKSDHVPSLVTVQEDPIKVRPVSASETTLCQAPTAGTHSTDVFSTTKANPALAEQTATSDECYASPADAVRHLATDVYAEETYQLPNDAVRSVIGNTCKDDAAATPRGPTQVRRSENRPTSIALSDTSAQQGVLLVEEDTYIMPADSIKPGTVRHTAQSGITPTTDSDNIMVTHQATTSTVSTTDPGADIADAYQLPTDIKLEQAAASRTEEAGMDPADTYAMPADAIGVRSTPKAEAQVVAPSTIATHNPTDPTPRREVYAQVQPKSQRMRETGDSNVSSHSSGAGEPTIATPSVAGAAPPTIPRRYRKTSWHGEQADIDIGNQQYKSSKWSNMFSHVKRKISAGSERRTDMKQPGSPRTSRPLPSLLPEEVAPGNLIKKIDDSNALAEEPQYMLCGPQLISQLSMPSDTTSLSKMAAALPALPRRNTAPPAPEDVLGPIYSLATTSTLSGQAATAEKAHDNASTSSSITHVHTFESDLDQEMYAELQVPDTPQRLLPATDNTSQIDTAMLQNTSNVIPDCSSEEVYAEIGVDKIDKKSTSNADSCYAAPVDAIVSACASDGTRGQDETYAAVVDAKTSACESDSTRGQDETYAAPIDAVTSACERDSTRGQDETYEAPLDAKTSAYESDSTRGQDETYAAPVDAITSAYESNSTRRQGETYAAPVDALTSAYGSDSTRGQDETYAAPVDAITSASKSDSTRGQEETYATPLDSLNIVKKGTPSESEDTAHAHAANSLKLARMSPSSTADTAGKADTGASSLGVHGVPVDAITSAQPDGKITSLQYPVQQETASTTDTYQVPVDVKQQTAAASVNAHHNDQHPESPVVQTCCDHGDHADTPAADSNVYAEMMPRGKQSRSVVE